MSTSGPTSERHIVTTLVAVQGNGWVVLGCDSRTSDESGRHMITVNQKIVNNNGILVAGAGMSRGSNIMQFGYVMPKPGPRTKLDTFMSRVFIPRMRKEFKEAGYDMKEDGGYAEHDSCFLIATKGVIFPLFEDYSWDRDEGGVYYMGSGGDVALGAMAAMGVEKVKTPSEAEDIIRKAIAIAIKHDIYCAAPVHTFTQYADGRIIKSKV